MYLVENEQDMKDIYKA